MITKNSNFIKVNEEFISLTEAMNYLQTRGKLGSFVNEIIHEYILQQELSKIELPNNIVDRTIDDFCKSNQLNSENFAQWLHEEGQTIETFTKQINHSIKLQELIFKVTESKVSEYFIEHKLLLDSFILSRLIVKEQELAEELKTQIIEENASFEELAKEYSISSDSHFNGMMGLVSRGQLDDSLRAALDKAQEGEIVGAIPFDNCWCLLRVEKIIPASLKDGKFKEKIRQEIFEDYLAEKMQHLEIEMNLVN